MGYERSTYFYDRSGKLTENRSSDSVIQVTSVEHDVYGRPSFDAVVLDRDGATEALQTLRRTRSTKECSAIKEALRLDS